MILISTPLIKIWKYREEISIVLLPLIFGYIMTGLVAAQFNPTLWNDLEIIHFLLCFVSAMLAIAFR